jgi:NTE family protein
LTGSSKFPARIALVFGGGGLKGFAHIGVLRALSERGIRPALVAGTSIGALIAAAHAGGMPIEEMEARAIALKQRDLFRIDHLHMITRRMRAPSLYLGGPLDKIIREIVPPCTFDELEMPLLVNTVDLERAAQLIWGLPGFRDVPIADAVYASCALPGFFPPRVIKRRTVVDGGVMDNMPAQAAAAGMDAVIAVDVGSTSLATARRIREQGFAAIYMRAAQTMMRSLQSAQLAAWAGPPLLLVRPPVWKYSWFSFQHTRRIIQHGYESALDALDRAGDSLLSTGGVYPRKLIELGVDRGKCTGCRLCATLAPDVMAMGDDDVAYVTQRPVEWSRADGDFVHQCPTHAITVQIVAEDGRRLLMKHQIESD